MPSEGTKNVESRCVHQEKPMKNTQVLRTRPAST